ncbi:MAG: CBS domain-containing protein [Actinobacteria bacterium]|nr:CBS domain-containing protein [Actinomycetota bacterium]
MHVAQILAHKGNDVASVLPDDTVGTAVAMLGELRIGALMVSSLPGRIDGIVSERDVVRRLASDGPALLEQPVSEIMTPEVFTCAVGDTVQQLMERMTEHRIRHLPVCGDDGLLVGIISIGDVVKWRVNELEDEARHLQGYISGTGYA